MPTPWLALVGSGKSLPFIDAKIDVFFLGFKDAFFGERYVDNLTKKKYLDQPGW